MAPQEIIEAELDQQTQLGFPTLESSDYAVPSLEYSKPVMVSSCRDALDSVNSNALSIGALDELLLNASKSITTRRSKPIFQVSSPINNPPRFP